MKIQEINKLGKELELYTFIDYIGKGFPIILPRGARIIKLLRNYVEYEEENAGYKVVRTPSISNAEIYKIEDRYEIQKDELFIIKNQNEDNSNEIILKPYTIPFHCSIYNLEKHSYKELPIKYCETSTVFRNERDIRGITKSRQFTLSDASLFCNAEKLQENIKEAIMLQKKFIKKLDLNVTFEIVTWDDEKKEDYIGTIQEWEYAIECMKKALGELNLTYKITKKAKMFGPAIQLYYNENELSSLQIDFEITHRFDVKYVDKSNEEKFPIYIHNTMCGSYENLLSILIEKYEGEFPFWLSPTQAVIIAEDTENEEYALYLKEKLIENKIRTQIDKRLKSWQSKITENTNLKIPYIVKVGKKEQKNNTVTIFNKEKQRVINIDELIKEVIDWQTKC